MVLSHPMQFTDRTSWYSHIVPCLFSCLIAIFSFYLYIHHDYQLPVPLQGLPSLQRRTDNLSIITSFSLHTEVIYSEFIQEVYHSTVCAPTIIITATVGAISGPCWICATDPNKAKTNPILRSAKYPFQDFYELHNLDHDI